MDQKAHNEEEIIKLVVMSQEGNSEAFGKLYDIFVKPIYRYVFFRVGERESEDLTELIFLKVWENIGQFQSGYRNFSSWLFRIAHNVVIDHYRLHQVEDELTEELLDHRREANTSLQAKLHLDQTVLSEAMKELKDHYRQVLILKYMEDFSNEEISHIMGRSQAALRILQFRALKSLRKILERRGISEFDA